MTDRILTPEEISALLDGTTPSPWRNSAYFIESDVDDHSPVAEINDGPDARLIAAAPDLARTALAAIAVARRLADGWRVLDDCAWESSDGTFEAMEDDESAFWAALEGASDG